MLSVSILSHDEPPAVAVHNGKAASPFLLVGDHAGNRIPRALGDMGLSDAERARHIAWDIGICDLGMQLADRLGATFILQRYSRLVIDCNRKPGAPDSIPQVSDGTWIPANAELDAADAAKRAEAILAPYQAAISAELDWRAAAGLPTILVALHSFTPVMQGVVRPWQVGILHEGGDNRFARAMIAAFSTDSALTVGDNEPYRMDIVDFTVPLHAYPRGLPYAEIEIRQDLLGHSSGVREWTGRLEQVLSEANESLG